jgi:hypothetical protein
VVMPFLRGLCPIQGIFTRNHSGITSSEKCDFSPFRINSSGDKDLKSFRISTSEKHPGVGGYLGFPCIDFFDACWQGGSRDPSHRARGGFREKSFRGKF